MGVTININLGSNEAKELVKEIKHLLTKLMQDKDVNVKEASVSAPSKKALPVKFKPATTVKTRRCGRKRSCCFTPDQVLDFVCEYDEIVHRTDTRGIGIIKEIKRRFKLTQHENTIERAIFRHKGIPGYEEIPTPQRQVARQPTYNLQVRHDVEEIKYLRDVKSLPVEKIIPMIDAKEKWIRRVYEGITYTDVCITRDNSIVFDQKYKDLDHARAC